MRFLRYHSETRENAVTYCFVCPECGHTVESPQRESAPTCMHIGVHIAMRRDYRAETHYLSVKATPSKTKFHHGKPVSR